MYYNGTDVVTDAMVNTTTIPLNGTNWYNLSLIMMNLLYKWNQKSTHTWVPSESESPIPPNTVIGGHEKDGRIIYVGRLNHEKDLLPAKIVNEKNKNTRAAYSAWNAREIRKSKFDVLIGRYYAWIPVKNNIVPPTAVCVGKTESGKILYMGRVSWEYGLTPGKIEDGSLWVPYGTKEHYINDNYEVLIQPDIWISSSSLENNIFSGVIYAGKDVDGQLIYVGRAIHNNEILPAKVIPQKKLAFIGYNGKEVTKDKFELLIGNIYEWVADQNGVVPHNAVECGKTEDGEILYMGRGYWGDALIPGKIHLTYDCLYITTDGQEFCIQNYEVLVRRCDV